MPVGVAQHVILLIKNSRRKTKVKKVQKNKKNEKREGREDKKQERRRKNTKSENREQRKETGKRKKREQQQMKKKERGSKRKRLEKRPNPRCHRCGKKGHYRRECWSDAPPMVCVRHYLVLKRLFSTELHRYLINIFAAFWSPFLMSFVAVIEVLRTLRFTLICPMGFM